MHAFDTLHYGGCGAHRVIRCRAAGRRLYRIGLADSAPYQRVIVIIADLFDPLLLKESKNARAPPDFVKLSLGVGDTFL